MYAVRFRPQARSVSWTHILEGPLPQIKAIRGPKKGFNQGELGGALKELGFKEDQVRLERFLIAG